MPWHEGYPSQGAQQTLTRFLAHSQESIEAISEPSVHGDYGAFYAQLREAILGKGQAPVSMDQACQLIYGLCLAEQSSETGQRMSWDYKAN